MNDSTSSRGGGRVPGGPHDHGPDPGHDHEHGHDGHDHSHHGHAHEAPAPVDLSRYEGVDGIAVREVSEVEREMLAVLPHQHLVQEEDAAARDLARRVNLKGFRPGKVPPARVKALFGREVRERAVERLVQGAWQRAQQEQALRPVAAPVLTEMSIEPGQPVRFAARFEVLPEVTLQGLSAVAVQPRSVRVTDADVDAEIENIRNMRAEFAPSEATEASPGDFVVVDLERWAAGGSREEDPAETGRSLVVEVGNEKNLPELDRALLGLGVGESRSFDARVAREGEDTTTAPFRVTLREIRKRRLPELDDAFAASLGFALGVASLREEVRKRLVEARTDAARREQEAEAMEQLVRSNPLKVPPSLIDQEAEARVRRGLEQLAQRGIDVESAGLDLRAELDRARAGAERDLRADWLLELVAREKGVEVGDADVQEEIARIAEGRGVSAGALRAELEKNKQINNLRSTIRRRRTLDLLRSGATISVD